MPKELTQKQRKKKFLDDLVASIKNEARTFNMYRFVKNSTEDQIAYCGTASCIAGHIEAIRRPLAKQLIEEDSENQVSYPVYPSYEKAPRHAELAAKIYELETGEPCNLDFYGHNTPNRSNLTGITRKQAVSHVRGTSKKWPQRCRSFV